MRRRSHGRRPSPPAAGCARAPRGAAHETVPVPRAGVAIALAALLVVAAAASASAASPSPGAATVYRIGIIEDYDGINPFSAWSGPSWECFRLCYNFLTWYDQDYKPVARPGAQLGDLGRRQDVDLPHHARA